MPYFRDDPLGASYAAAYLYRDDLMHYPVNVGVSDPGFGNAVGFEEEAIPRAFYEFVERRHFLQDVPVDDVVAVADYADGGLGKAMQSALAQASGAGDRRFDANAPIAHTPIAHTLCLDFANRRHLIPHCLISLTPSAEDVRLGLMPFRDTSGCALGSTVGGSRTAALCEFAERQALVASWIAGSAEAEIIDLDEGLRDRRVARLAKELGALGDVVALSLGCGVPGYTVFCLFQAHNRRQSSRFASGCAYALNAEAAVSKALLELWHCWVGASIKTSCGYGDRLDKNLALFNAARPQRNIRFFGQPGAAGGGKISLTDLLKRPERSERDLIDWLADISRHVFWYSRPVAVGDRLLIASRVVSPDFFLHIDTSKSLNLQNGFARSISLDVDGFDSSPLCFA